MSVEVRRATPDDLERWDRHVERSPAGGLFHQLSALEVQAAHTDTRLHPLIGHKGQEPVGVFPVFERTIGPRPAASVRTAFSPPPGIHVIDCGPASLNLAKLKQRKAERRHERFVAGAFEWIDEAIDPVYTHLRLPGAYPDTRPFAWNDCTVTPRHTYHVDLTVGEEELLDSFSSDARSNVRDGRDRDDVVVREGDRDAIAGIVNLVRGRYESQGLSFGLTAAFVEDLYDRLPEGQVRPYVCRVDGEFVGGILALSYGDTVSRWQGGVTPDRDDVDVAINDLLD